MSDAASRLLAAAVLALLPAPAAASDALRSLDGRWRGPDFEILIDVERLLASTDPTKPFGREPLHVKNIAGPWVTFAIGGRTFFAQVEDGALHLVRPGKDGARLLSRVP